MEWNQIISKRRNTYNWKTEIPPIELINQIVEEIHKYCPSKQRKIPFYLDVLDTADYNHNPEAYDLLIANRSVIAQELIDWIDQQVKSKKIPFKGYIYDKSKCHRDIEYVLSGYANDLKYNSNLSTVRNAKSYWKEGKPQVRQFAEILAHKFIKSKISLLFEENKINNESMIKISNLSDIIINVIDKGVSAAPSEEPGQNNIRHEIFEGTDRKGLGFADDIRNPQVLAPFLFVFSTRSLTEKEIGLNNELNDHIKARNVSENEIGLASMFAVLSATNKGLDTGFCACIRNGSKIAEMLGHQQETVLLYLGIGYRDNSEKYYSPLIHNHLDIPKSDYDQKPELSTYFKLLNL